MKTVKNNILTGNRYMFGITSVKIKLKKFLMNQTTDAPGVLNFPRAMW